MQFVYTVQNKMGLHVGPATVIAKEAQKFNSTMTVSAHNKSADLKKVFGMVGLGAKCGESILIEIRGDDEEQAFACLKKIVEQTL